MKVLVTAVGGVLGQSVVKSLRLSAGRYELHGSDMQNGIGAMFVDHFHHLPPAFPYGPYLQALGTLCDRHHIAAVIPSSEAEIRSLCLLPAHPMLPCGARIVSQPPAVIETLGDKLKCFQSLVGRVPLADFADAQDRTVANSFVAKHSFPLCMKERISSGRRGVLIIKDAADFDREWPKFKQPLLQALIDGDDKEYSVGVFVHGCEVRLISYRRRLDELGCSWFAELDQPAAVLAYCREVALAAKVRGSINVQLRLSKSGPLMLEINPRFSSLASARAACGFNDVEWSVLQALGHELLPCPATPATFRYQRYIAEALDFGEGLHVPKAWAPRMK